MMKRSWLVVIPDGQNRVTAPSNFSLARGQWNDATVSHFLTFKALVNAEPENEGITRSQQAFICNDNPWKTVLIAGDFVLGRRLDDGNRRRLEKSLAGGPDRWRRTPKVLSGVLPCCATLFTPRESWLRIGAHGSFHDRSTVHK